MKTPSIFPILAILSLFLISAGPQEKTSIIGPWRLYKALGPGAANPDNKKDRLMVFNEDNTFYGSMVNQNMRRPYNRGHYYLIDNRKLVTVHYDIRNKTGKAGNVYTYSINGDTLCLEGYFLLQSPKDTMVFISVPINEIWVREK